VQAFVDVGTTDIAGTGSLLFRRQMTDEAGVSDVIQLMEFRVFGVLVGFQFARGWNYGADSNSARFHGHIARGSGARSFDSSRSIRCRGSWSRRGRRVARSDPRVRRPSRLVATAAEACLNSHGA
jgi:hypothetical protein